MDNNRPKSAAGEQRVTDHRSVILSEDGQLVLRNEQKTILTEHGILTEDTAFSLMIEGEHITDISQIAGKCRDCNRFVTATTKKYCFYCGKINCTECSSWDEENQRWVCPACRKALRRKKLIGAIFGFLKPKTERKTS